MPPTLISRACVPAVHDFERDELAMLPPCHREELHAPRTYFSCLRPSSARF